MSNNEEIKSEEEKDAEEIHHKPQRRRSRYGRRRGDNIEGTPLWLISFTDIMALMLTFFVLLYAMSDPEEKSWSEIMAALNKEFHVFYGPRLEAGDSDVVDVGRVNFNRALPLDYLHSLLDQQLAEIEQQKDVNIHQLDNELVISLSDEALFAAGSVDLQKDAARQLFNLGNSLSRIRNRIEVVGHSDPAPITNTASEFASNWELSLERAAVVASTLKKTGYTQPIIVRGNSSVHYKDLDDGSGEDLRKRFSRRVDIHIMTDDGRRTLEKRLKLQ